MHKIIIAVKIIIISVIEKTGLGSYKFITSIAALVCGTRLAYYVPCKQQQL